MDKLVVFVVMILPLTNGEPSSCYLWTSTIVLCMHVDLMVGNSGIEGVSDRPKWSFLLRSCGEQSLAGRGEQRFGDN